MAQRIKKQLFRILPVSLVGLMVLVLVVSSWQILPIKMAKAAAINAAAKTDVTPGTQFTTSKGTPVYRLSIANTGDADDAITSLYVTPSGSVNDTLVTLHFFQDANNNGIADQGDTDLGASAAFASDETGQTFNITDVTVPASGNASILITADIAGVAGAQNFKLSFAAATDIAMTVSPSGTFPMTNANFLTISNTAPAVTVADGANDPAAKTVKASAANVAVKQLTISETAGTSDSIVSLALTPAGTENDNTNITSVVFYIDSGSTPGQVDGTDVQLVTTPATYTADNTKTIFTFSSPVQIAASASVNILVVYNLGAGVVNGNTLTAIIALAGDVVAGSVTPVTQTSTISSTITIDTVAPSVVITDDEAGTGNIAGGDITYTFTFSEAVTGFDATDVTVVNGAKGLFTAVSGLSYTLVVTPTAGFTGNVTVDVAAAAGVDAALNPSTAATQSVQAVDMLAPTIASVTSDATGAGVLKVGQTIIFTVTPTIAEAGLTINAATYNGGALVWGTIDGGTTYTATYTVAEGQVDQAVALQLLGVTATDTVGNTGAAANGADVVKTIDANSPTIASVAVAPDGVTANVGDAITATITAGALQNDLSLAGACTINTVDVSGSFVNNANGTYTLTYNVGEGDADVASGTLAISCALQETSLNTVTASAFDANTLVIDANSPTLTFSDVYSDNVSDTSLASAGNYVIVEFTPSEPLMSQSVTFNNPIIGSTIPAVDDGTGCDALLGDNIWTACVPVSLTDTDGLADFNIDMTDLAFNPASIASGTLAASVTIDVTPPTLARVTAKTQLGAFPSHDSVLWYNYTGDTFEAYVQGSEILSEVRVCVRSLKELGAFTQTCDPTDFTNPANYITSGALGAASYTFTGTTFAAIAGANPLVDFQGYSMNVMIADAAGNVYLSLLPADAFVMIWNVEPSVLDPILANATTTLWSTISDFTTVSGLTFQAEQPLGTLLGQLSFPGALDLTDISVVNNLSSFASKVVVRGGDAANGLVDISVNSADLLEFDVAADLTIALPNGTTSQPGLVIYNNAGVACDYISNTAGSATNVCGTGKDISLIIFNAGPPETITFSTTGFSGFGADATAPTVTTFSPANAATGVATTATVSITFSEPVDTTSFTYTLPTAAGLSVAWSVGDTVATISHTAFTNSTPYTLTVTAVTDKVGNAIVGTPSATFTTVAVVPVSGGGYNPPADTTPPTNTSISINSGAAETASQSVTLTLGATDAAQMMIANSADFSGANWETYVTSKTWLLTGGVGEKTVYAKFKDAAGNISASVSDTINSTATTEIPADNIGLILQDPAPAPALPVGVNIGTLVKRADMSSVYFIDQDNRRHAFPNEAVYFSYYPDFSGVQIISSSIMAAIPLGSNVTMRPGTYLVKIQSDPKVYAVSPYGVLKGIGSEAIAAGLYGADWATRVIDVEPTFFTNYQIGPSVTIAIHPTGSAFSYLGDNKVYYVDGGNKRYISSDVFIINKFQNKFIIRNVATSITYPDGADLPAQGMDQIMTLR